MTSLADQNYFYSLLKQLTPCNKIAAKLLYKDSIHGLRSNFGDFCYNKGPTILLFLSNEGKRFGGYSSINWEIPSFTHEYK